MILLKNRSQITALPGYAVSYTDWDDKGRKGADGLIIPVIIVQINDIGTPSARAQAIAQCPTTMRGIPVTLEFYSDLATGHQE